MSEPIKVGVFGARGRMGSQVVSAVSDSADTELVATVDAGDDGTFEVGVTLPDALPAGVVEVVTDVTGTDPAELIIGES